MCGTSGDHEAIRKARELLDTVLGGVGVPVAKGFDLSTKQGFDRAAAQLSRELAKRTGPIDAAMVRAAIRPLNVAWSETTAEQRAALVREAAAAARKRAAPVREAIRAPFDSHAEEVVRGTKLEARNKQKLAVSARFTQLDRKVVSHVTRFQGNFVRDEYGKRADLFSERARAIVASGVARGLGDPEIGTMLSEAAQAEFVAKSQNYWDVVAAAFTGHSRSYSQMSAYQEARIERYKILAVLDEVTTPQCRFLDGKEFSVRTALDRFERVATATDPEQIKEIAPWIRQGSVGGQPVLYVNQGGARRLIADIVKSGVGAIDDRGEFRARVDDAGLDELGIGFPPYHALCRTTTIAVL